MTSNRGLAGVLMLLVLATLVACGGGGGGGGGADGAPAAALASATAVIGPAGGTLTGPDGVQVIVPAGALTQPTTIGIARSSAGAPAALPEDNPPAGPIYEFTPHGLVFNTPVTIRVPVPGNALGFAVFMASLGEDWQLNDATVTGGFAEWQRNSFSFGMLPLACAPANNPPYSSSQPDPFPCAYPRGAASASATPPSAITRRTSGGAGFVSGDAGSWVVNQASTVTLTLRYVAVPDCVNPRVRLLRLNPAVPLSTPGRVQTLLDQAVVLTQTSLSLPAGTFGGAGTYVRGVGNTTFDVSLSHLDNGTTAFGFSFSCNRLFRPTQSGGDLLTFISSIPVPSVTHTIGGAASGLTGAGLVLRNNGGDNLAVPANGSFTFATAIAAGAPYSVSVLTQPSGQTCTVQNGSGTASANVTNVAVNCITTFPVGGTVSGLSGSGLVLQNNGADNLAVAANGAFTFATPVVASAPYSVSVLTQPSGATCTVQNGGGTASAPVTNVAVTCTSAGGLALVANSGSNTLSIFRVNASTGALSPLGTVATGNFPFRIAITPNGLFAYVTNLVGGTLSSYSINSTTGVLSLIPLSSPGTANPFGIAMDPLGRFVWVANYNFHTVSAFAINASTGVLTAVGSPVATGTLPYALTVHPSGNYVYVVNEAGNSVSAFSVNATTGALTLLGGTIANSVLSPHSIAVDPSGQFAYVANSNSVAAFKINASTGTLTVIGYFNTGSAPQSVAVHPNGQFVYAAIQGSNNISVFSINASTGALTAVGSPIATGTSPGTLAINTAGTFLYVTNLGGNSASAFSINASSGALTSLGAAVATGSGPEGIAVTP